MLVGFDVGGTKALGVAVHAGSTTPLVSHRQPTPASGDELVETVVSMVASISSEVDEPIKAVGLGVAGLIDREGWVRYSPNIAGVVDYPLRDRLAERLEMPVHVDNDANTATWAEARLGAGVGCSDIAFVALGTGIGTAFVLNGELYRGAHGFAGESGHIVVDRHGPKHLTGVQGPWEMFASGTGLGVLGRQWALEGRIPAVVAEAGSVEKVRGEHVSDAIAAGDADALTLLGEFAEDVVIGLHSLIYILDPELIILGGGLVDIGEPLRERVQRNLDETLLGGDYRPSVPVRLARLGSQAGALGAALLAGEATAG